jgi:hypothetical protein
MVRIQILFQHTSSQINSNDQLFLFKPTTLLLKNEKKKRKAEQKEKIEEVEEEEMRGKVREYSAFSQQSNPNPHSPVTSLQLKTSVQPKEGERKERGRRHNTGVQELLMSR